MQSSGIIQARKMLLFAALFLAILVPLFFTLAIRSQLSLVSPSGGSPLITYVHECMTSGFWMNMIEEGTSYGHLLSSPKYQIGMLLFFQSLVCVVITLLLLWLTLYCKKSYLAPFTVAYALMSALIFLATMGDRIISEGVGQYCVPCSGALIFGRGAASARSSSIWPSWDAILSALRAAAGRNDTGRRVVDRLPDNQIIFPSSACEI